ncbi:MAG: hypothetical protein JXA33_12705 [Anaerolineae bacterium]|nr:hypothetical protein [Anaerolineae bacterium]
MNSDDRICDDRICDQVFGFWEDMSAIPALGQHQMKLDAAQLAAHWRRCSLSSDFWARYTALFVPGIVPPGTLPRDAMEGVLSYLLNELFENCAKFSGGPVGDVVYQSWLLEDRIVFQITNHIIPEGQAPFIDLIVELLENDPDELYFRRLEANAEDELRGSGLGYLTLIKDYDIRFGFQFKPGSPESIAVSVQAHVSREETL